MTDPMQVNKMHTPILKSKNHGNTAKKSPPNEKTSPHLFANQPDVVKISGHFISQHLQRIDSFVF